MNEQAIVQFLAEKIWRLQDGWWVEDYDEPHFVENRKVILESEFDPLNRIEHAWMVVEKFDWIEIGRDNGEYFCYIYSKEYGEVVAGEAYSPTAPKAICLAAARAQGYEE